MEGILTQKGAADSADHGVEGRHTSNTHVASMPETLALEVVGSTKFYFRLLYLLVHCFHYYNECWPYILRLI